MSIGRASHSDELAVIALWLACERPRNYNDPSDDFHFTVCGACSDVQVNEDEAGQIDGRVMVGHDGRRKWLHYVATAPIARGAGLGRTMVQAAEQWLRRTRSPHPGAALPRRCKEQRGHDRGELYRIFGVDLTNVPGISAITAQTILCEIGTDVSRFRNASAFASWLGLCPEKKVSGGKVLFTKSRRVRSRVATALRMGAQSLHHAKDYLGEFFRRITRKLGRPQAITATAHKLARIVYHLLGTKEAYNESVFHKSEADTIRRAEYRLRKQAAQLGFQVIPAENN